MIEAMFRRVVSDLLIAITCLALLAPTGARGEAPDTVFLEDLTWTEVRDAIRAGKTTIINLLLRFYAPTSGQVLLDGRDVRDYPLGPLRRRLGLVLQDVAIRSRAGVAARAAVGGQARFHSGASASGYRSNAGSSYGWAARSARTTSASSSTG